MINRQQPQCSKREGQVYVFSAAPELKEMASPGDTVVHSILIETMQKDEFVFCEEHHCGYKILLSRLVIVFLFQTARQYNKPPPLLPPSSTPRFPLTTSLYELNHKRGHHHSTSTMTLRSNISILLLLGFTFTTLLTPVAAKHKVNDPCTNKKYFNTLGCSESECQVVRISTLSSSSKMP